MQSEEPRSRAGAARRWCVFTSAGDRNVVAGWLPPDGARCFDLFVAYYGDDDTRFAELSRLADRAWRIKGGKAQNLRALLQAGEIDLSPYSHVWLPDDDLLLDPRDIPRLFDLAERFGFVVCQPAFDPLGRVSYPHTAVDRTRGEARLVNFVEMTCPLFRRESLEEFMQAFDGSLSAEGLDVWYGHVLGGSVPGRFGVIDAVTVFNPHERQKPGGFREIDLAKARQARRAEFLRAAERHGFPAGAGGRVFGVLPLPDGWRAANPPHPDPPRVPRPSDLALGAADRAVLATALTPAPATVLQWGVDGITAALLAAGTRLAVAAGEKYVWLRSCRHDPTFAEAFADGRLVAVQPRPRAAANTPAPSPGAAAAAVLAQRGAWPELVVAPEARVPSLLTALAAAFANAGARPMPRILAVSAGGAPGSPAAGTARQRVVASGERLRLFAPDGQATAPAAPGSAPSPLSARPARFGALRMTAEETAAFRDALAAARSFYFEWGLGGSTLAALEARAARVISVESDPAWAAKARQDARIAAAERAGRLVIVTPDLGPVGRWGAPLDANRVAESWRDYVMAPLQDGTAAAGALPEVVLVDGRFRAACCFAVAELCLARGEASPLLLLHDADRPAYASVLSAWEKIGTTGSLWVLRLRADADRRSVRAALERHGPRPA